MDKHGASFLVSVQVVARVLCKYGVGTLGRCDTEMNAGLWVIMHGDETWRTGKM